MRTPWQRSRLGGSPFEALETRHLLSGTPELLVDLNQLETANPRHFAEYDGRLFFVADHELYGAEIWTSNGTDAGTQLLSDLNPGPAGSDVRGFVASGGLLYFVADNGATGAELWRTDGTAVGTVPIGDIAPGPASGLALDAELVDAAGTLFFLADNGAGAQLWKTGGTPPVPVKDITPNSTASGISEMAAIEGRLFFVGNDGVNGSELWASDGSEWNTFQITEFSTNSSASGPSDLTSLGGALFYSAVDGPTGRSLYRTNGLLLSTHLVASDAGPTGFNPRELTVFGSELLFQATTLAGGTELWKTDMTGSGATLVADIEAGSDSSTPEDLTAAGNALFFTTERDGQHRLWKTDGTAPGTVQLTSHPGSEPWRRPDHLTVLADKLYFTMQRGDESTSLWRTDGTPAGTFKIVDEIIEPGNRVSPTELGAAAGRLFFRRIANNSDFGGQLWQYDPGVSAASLVKYLPSSSTESSFAHGFVQLAARTLFIAQDGISGEQLWSRQGSNAPVKLTSQANIQNLTVVGSRAYFTLTNAMGNDELWRTDGTLASTQPVSNLFQIANGTIGNLREVSGRLFFTAISSSSGNMAVFAVGTSGTSVGFSHWLGAGTPASLAAGAAHGVYYVVGPGPLGELWRSNGTTAGTYRVQPNVPLAASLWQAANFMTIESSLYFTAYGPSGIGLWKVPTAGAVAELLTTDLDTSGFDDAFVEVAASGGRVYFAARSLSGDWQLFANDGTVGGTELLLTLPDPGYGRPAISQLTDLAGSLMFVAQGGQQAYTLWRSIGTEAGTTPVAALSLDANHVAPSEFTAVGDLLYFRPGSGGVLAQSDGTPAGTFVHTWDGPSQISDLTNLDGLLVFSGYQHDYGWEAWSYEPFQPAVIVGRKLFYNQSKFDGNNANLTTTDDNAIATDKSPYFAGTGLATFGNISSYSRGINGVMIEIANLPLAAQELSPADFEFRVGKNSNLNTWTPAPAPNGFAIRSPVGDLEELARISIRWVNNVVQNVWLEVTVLANERTGLSVPDVFYFGSRIGDSGSGSPTAAVTSAADELAARFAPGVNQPITSLLDFDRSGAVTAVDPLIARNNDGILLKLNLPAPQAAAPVVNLAVTSVDDDLADIAAQSLVEPLVTRALAEESARTSPSRAELLACAAQAWSEWLSVEDEDKLIGTQVKTARSRR